MYKGLWLNGCHLTCKKLYGVDTKVMTTNKENRR